VGGGVVGVHSLSEAQPLKSANFSGADREFEGKLHYSEWVFYYQPNNPRSGIGKRK
jgi:hypothetical protein